MPTARPSFAPRVRLDRPSLVLADDGRDGPTIATRTIGPLTTPGADHRPLPFAATFGLGPSIDPREFHVRVVVHAWDGWPIETVELDVRT